MPVYMFLEEYDFAGKIILPIATHKGSFLGNSVSDLKQLLSESNVKSGIAISGRSVDYLKYWIISVLMGIILLILSAGMVKNYKEDSVKSKVWFACAVAGLLLIVVCVIKLLI